MIKLYDGVIGEVAEIFSLRSRSIIQITRVVMSLSGTNRTRQLLAVARTSVSGGVIREVAEFSCLLSRSLIPEPRGTKPVATTHYKAHMSSAFKFVPGGVGGWCLAYCRRAVKYSRPIDRSLQNCTARRG